MPRGPDIFISNSPSTYPFATLFPATPEECIPQLLDILPPRKELQDYLAAFEKRVYVCAFPHLPVELTKNEIDRFLDDPERNARMCPEMLALIFAAIALGAQHSVWDQCAGSWKAEVVDAEAQRGNVYGTYDRFLNDRLNSPDRSQVAAAMQALRLSSFMHKPSLLAIETLIMIGPFLSNSGRFLDAWTLFGTTVRLAQAIGLHRHPKYLDPAPPTQGECAIRQTLWWWMLHMDEQYSMTLGRPLGISGIGDCPPPHELTTDPRMLRFGEFINHFTILARQILSSDRLTNAKIDEFTDQLRGLLDTMPEMLQFDDSWLDKDKEIPEWPLSAMSAGMYLLLTAAYWSMLTFQSLLLQNAHISHPSESPEERQIRDSSWNYDQGNFGISSSQQATLFTCFANYFLAQLATRKTNGALVCCRHPDSFPVLLHSSAGITRFLDHRPTGFQQLYVASPRRPRDGQLESCEESRARIYYLSGTARQWRSQACISGCREA